MGDKNVKELLAKYGDVQIMKSLSRQHDKTIRMRVPGNYMFDMYGLGKDMHAAMVDLSKDLRNVLLDTIDDIESG